MPHLHLPAEHSDADLVLAANLADIVGSEDLYVAWTHESGPGLIPEIEAIVRDERPGVFTELVGAFFAGLGGLLRAFFTSGAPAAAPAAPQQVSARAPQS